MSTDSIDSSSYPTINLHDAGDMTLLLGTGANQQSVRVSSTTLCLASPVWKEYFENYSAKGESSNIIFHEADVEAMLLVLRIAHLHFNELPGENGLTFQALLGLAIVCDRYDLVRLVRPFLDLYGWVQPYLYPSYPMYYNPDWLFVAWTFGYSESFDDLAKDLAVSITVHPSLLGSGKKVISKNGQLLGQNMPPGILESILEVRITALSCMLKDCYSALDKVIDGKVCQVLTERSEPAVSKCRSMILGSLTIQLMDAGLYPNRKNAEDIEMSVLSLQTLLQNIKVQTIDSHDYAEMVTRARKLKGGSISELMYSPDREFFIDHGVTSHSKCGGIVDLAKCAKWAVSRMASPTLESHREHMEEQAKK